MKFKVNDEVIVIAGAQKSKVGKILKIMRKTNQVIIKDINIITKHLKPTQQKTEGSIKKMEAPIDASNIAYLVEKASKDKPAVYSKLKYETQNNKKKRLIKKTGKAID